MDSSRAVCTLVQEEIIRADENGCPTTHVTLMASAPDDRLSFDAAIKMLRNTLFNLRAQRDGRSGIYINTRDPASRNVPYLVLFRPEQGKYMV